MCHSRNTDQLARFANHRSEVLSDAFTGQVSGITAPPRDGLLLRVANVPLLLGTERFFHLDGSRDDSREIAFLAGDSPRLPLRDPLMNTNAEAVFED